MRERYREFVVQSVFKSLILSTSLLRATAGTGKVVVFTVPFCTSSVTRRRAAAPLRASAPIERDAMTDWQTVAKLQVWTFDSSGAFLIVPNEQTAEFCQLLTRASIGHRMTR